MRYLLRLLVLICCCVAIGCGSSADSAPGTVTIDPAAKHNKTKAMKPPPPMKPK
jgi:hypothetical protein